ncbi:putative glyoxal oxidase, kelch-type beta propeller [Lupinus albus]|uniref:Putative glyoxal oxidase, kelch-type beta propeller n=1 Tax=Lupinus albus TaxID=3870 RepID=A0A6A4Q0S9_LUPAL|nr:putative glyoxal oxidase, kelch-type beta propeller [Lupinus albus]
MTQMMIKVLFICTLLFLSVDAKHRLRRRKYKLPKNGKFHQTPFFKFLPYQDEKIPFNPEADNKIPRKNKDDFGDANIPKNEELAKPDFEIESTGHWDLINQNSGVSAMHVNLLPTNKIIIYDSKIYKPSRLNLAPGMPCVPYKDDQTKENKLDCAAHSMEYDIETNEVKPLTVAAGDPWCSCGGLAPDGTFVSAGGFGDGGKTLRYVGGAQCQGAKDQCAWREYDNLLVDVRCYLPKNLRMDIFV